MRNFLFKNYYKRREYYIRLYYEFSLMVIFYENPFKKYYKYKIHKKELNVCVCIYFNE